MKMETLAYASLQHLSAVSLRLESCQVKALHRYVMEPVSVERFVYITQGEACFFVESKQLRAKERDMVYLPRNTAYQSKWLRESRFVVVDMELCNAEGQAIRFGENPCVLFHDTHHVYDGLLAEMAEKADTTGPFDWLERLSLSFKLLCEMARDTTWTESDEKYSRIKRGVVFLENNYAEDFSLEDLADMCALSAGYFRKLFMECKGTSPSDYRNRLRIRRAAELLRTGKYTVSEAAEQVGIRDIKYFGKLFYRYTGLKPSELKNGAGIERI